MFSLLSLAVASRLQAVVPPHMSVLRTSNHSTLIPSNRDYVAPTSLTDLATRIASHRTRVSAAGFSTDPLKPDDFFKFIPKFLGAPIPGALPITSSDSCFSSISLSSKWVSPGTLDLTLELAGKTSLLCNSLLLLGTATQVSVDDYLITGVHTVKYTGLSNTSIADINTHGLRVFSFNATVLVDVISFYDTLMLFLQGLIPLGPPAVPPAEAQANINFLHDHMGFDMPPRTPSDPLPIDPTLIHSGDFLGIIRLDGLDPMIAWGMGARLGHTAVALWENGTLWVCESQTDSHYWPVNRIQRTEWSAWIRLANLASYNVVWLPLRPAARAVFNEKAANAFFHSVEGVSYGFGNFLFGWIDGPGNLPPPLTSQLVMVGFALFDRLMHDTCEFFWNQAINHRVGTKGLNAADAYAAADRLGMTFDELLSVPEQDSWRYILPQSADPVTPHPSMVCNVFVCAVLKAGGMFGDIADSIQCTETTGRDVYALDIFDPAPPRPALCKQIDPANPHCQIMGAYQMQLVDAGTVAAYPHMREHCIGAAPEYYWANKTC